jgi:predicted small secreted protein
VAGDRSDVPEGGPSALNGGEQEMSRTLKLLVGLLALLVLPSLSACNTARGFGQDVQALGRAMSGTAEEVKEDVTSKTEPPKPATSETPAPKPATTQ